MLPGRESLPITPLVILDWRGYAKTLLYGACGLVELAEQFGIRK